MKIFEIIKWVMTLGDIAKGYKTYMLMAGIAFQGLGALLLNVVIPGLDADAGIYSLVMAIINSVELKQIIAAIGGATLKAGVDRK